MKKYYLLILLFFAGLGISAINPHDYFTWILEVFPAILGLIALMLTFNRFKFSYFTYIMILAHCYVLFIGAPFHVPPVPVEHY